MKIDRYVWEGRAEHLLALIQCANREDDTAEKLHSRWNGIGCTGVVLVILTFIAAVNLEKVPSRPESRSPRETARFRADLS